MRHRAAVGTDSSHRRAIPAPPPQLAALSAARAVDTHHLQGVGTVVHKDAPGGVRVGGEEHRLAQEEELGQAVRAQLPLALPVAVGVTHHVHDAAHHRHKQALRARHPGGRPPELQLLQHAVDKDHRQGGQGHSHRVGSSCVEERSQEGGGRGDGRGGGSHGLGGRRRQTGNLPATPRRGPQPSSPWAARDGHTRSGCGEERKVPARGGAVRVYAFRSTQECTRANSSPPPAGHMPPRQRAAQGGVSDTRPWPERLQAAYRTFLGAKAQRSYYRMCVTRLRLVSARHVARAGVPAAAHTSR